MLLFTLGIYFGFIPGSSAEFWKNLTAAVQNTLGVTPFTGLFGSVVNATVHWVGTLPRWLGSLVGGAGVTIVARSIAANRFNLQSPQGILGRLPSWAAKRLSVGFLRLRAALDRRLQAHHFRSRYQQTAARANHLGPPRRARFAGVRLSLPSLFRRAQHWVARARGRAEVRINETLERLRAEADLPAETLSRTATEQRLQREASMAHRYVSSAGVPTAQPTEPQAQTVEAARSAMDVLSGLREEAVEALQTVHDAAFRLEEIKGEQRRAAELLPAVRNRLLTAQRRQEGVIDDAQISALMLAQAAVSDSSQMQAVAEARTRFHNVIQTAMQNEFASLNATSFKNPTDAQAAAERWRRRWEEPVAHLQALESLEQDIQTCAGLRDVAKNVRGSFGPISPQAGASQLPEPLIEARQKVDHHVNRLGGVTNLEERKRRLLELGSRHQRLVGLLGLGDDGVSTATQWFGRLAEDLGRLHRSLAQVQETASLLAETHQKYTEVRRTMRRESVVDPDANRVRTEKSPLEKGLDDASRALQDARVEAELRRNAFSDEIGQYLDPIRRYRKPGIFNRQVAERRRQLEANGSWAVPLPALREKTQLASAAAETEVERRRVQFRTDRETLQTKEREVTRLRDELDQKTEADEALYDRWRLLRGNADSYLFGAQTAQGAPMVDLHREKAALAHSLQERNDAGDRLEQAERDLQRIREAHAASERQFYAVVFNLQILKRQEEAISEAAKVAREQVSPIRITQRALFGRLAYREFHSPRERLTTPLRFTGAFRPARPVTQVDLDAIKDRYRSLYDGIAELNARIAALRRLERKDAVRAQRWQARDERRRQAGEPRLFYRRSMAETLVQDDQQRLSEALQACDALASQARRDVFDSLILNLDQPTKDRVWARYREEVLRGLNEQAARGRPLDEAGQETLAQRAAEKVALPALKVQYGAVPPLRRALPTALDLPSPAEVARQEFGRYIANLAPAERTRLHDQYVSRLQAELAAAGAPPGQRLGRDQARQLERRVIMETIWPNLQAANAGTISLDVEDLAQALSLPTVDSLTGRSRRRTR